VKSGRWFYDDSVERPVDIVSLDCDFWHEIARAEGALEESEEPMALGKEGFLYCVRFRNAGEVTTPTWVDSGPYATIAEAVSHAESKTPSPVTWIS